MKKLLMLMLAMVMLAGCTAVKVPLDVDFKKEVLKSIREASEVELPEFSENNSHKEYYDYYLFQGVGRKEIDQISNIFIFYDNEAVLNLDVVPGQKPLCRRKLPQFPRSADELPHGNEGG